MALQKTSSRSFVILAKLATVTFISLGFATTLHLTTANTLSSSSKTKTYSVAVAPGPVSAARTKKTYTIALPPLPQPVQAEHSAAGLDAAMGVLTPENAALYRTIFAAQKAGEWSKADRAVSSLTDTSLMAHVLAQRLQLRGTSSKELAEWLKDHADYPEAETIYKIVLRHDRALAKSLPKPLKAEAWSSGHEADTAPNFVAEIKTDALPRGSSADKLVRAINQAIRRGDPGKARDLFVAAQAQQPLSGTLAADAEAAIAASYFYMGEREQAKSLSNAAAVAQQPLGLWIRGLIAWEQNDISTASAHFLKLSTHPALDEGNCAAAHFWAYRALERNGEKQDARQALLQAANYPKSFYGLLAGQLLGRNSAVAQANEISMPAWNKEHRALLASLPIGSRALALVQAGEAALAEKELRYLNPQGQPKLQHAMMALANYVPMPALALQLASLANDGQGRAAMLYPLLPWQPQSGYDIDRALIFALARHESLFDTTAVSPRGAVGLLQIMPQTAGIMDDDLAVVPRHKLFDPAYNLSLGQKYVRHLSRQPQIGNNLLLLLAAYNSGPGKVMRWYETETLRKESAALDPLLFIESLPQRETRNYVMRVLPHYWAYRAKLDKPLVSLKQLAEGKWPKVSLAEEGVVLKVASRKAP